MRFGLTGKARVEVRFEREPRARVRASPVFRNDDEAGEVNPELRGGEAAGRTRSTQCVERGSERSLAFDFRQDGQ